MITLIIVGLYLSPFTVSLTCIAVALATNTLKRRRDMKVKEDNSHKKRQKKNDGLMKTAMEKLEGLSSGALKREVLWETRIFTNGAKRLASALLAYCDEECSKLRFDDVVSQIMWTLSPYCSSRHITIRTSFVSPTAVYVKLGAPNLVKDVVKDLFSLLNKECCPEVNCQFGVNCDDRGARLAIEVHVAGGRKTREFELQEFEHDFSQEMERNSLVGHKTLIVSKSSFLRQWVDELLLFRGAKSTIVGSQREVKSQLACSRVEGENFGAAFIDGMGQDSGEIKDAVFEIRRVSPGLPLIVSVCPRALDTVIEALGKLDHVHVLVGPIVGTELLAVFEQVLDHPPKIEDSITIPDGAVSPTKRSLNILIAEDHPVNSEFACEILKARGHHVHAVENGAEALYLFKRQVFDVILMDLSMPVLDGVQTTLRMRELEKKTGKYTPIISVTANTDKRRRESIIAAGADSILNKPVVAKELILATEEAAFPDDEGLEKEENPSTSCMRRVSVPFDDREALRHVNGNRSLLAKLIKTFLSDAPMRLERLRIAVGGADVVKLHEAAHSLKGAAGYIGAHGVSEMASRLCDMGRHHCLDGAPETLSVLEDEYQRLTPILRSYLAD